MEIEEDIDIRRLIDIAFSKKKIIVLIMIICMAIGYIYSYYLKQDIYKSSETILLAQNENEDMQITQNDLNVNTNLITTYSNIAKSTNVVETTINNLGLQISIAEVQNNIIVESKKNTQIIEITVKNKNPETAMKLTKELTNVFTEQIKKIYNLQNINIIDEAEIESFPCNINHTKDISIAIVIGVILSGILVLIFYIFDDTIKQESDIINYTGLQSLGIIPVVEDKKQNQELISHLNPKSYVAEALKTVRTNILYTTSTNKRKAILITSPKQEEGKTWISNNIAVSFAQAKKKTIIVDCDLRNNKSREEFNINNEEGLSNCINKITKSKIENVEIIGDYIKETNIPNLHILTNGTIPPNPLELISSDNMKKLIITLKYMYDIVILDSTPCLEVSDSIALASMVDNTILIVESKKTKISEVKKSKKSIEDVDGKIAGVIVNKKKISKGGYYGKNYGYGYYYGHDEENSDIKREEQKGFTVAEIIEQAKVSIKEEERQNRNKTIRTEKNTKGQKVEIRVIKLIKRLFEKVLRIQKNVDRNQISEEIRQLREEQEKNKVDISNQIKDLNEDNKNIKSKILGYEKENIRRDELLEKLEKQNEKTSISVAKLKEDNQYIINKIDELVNKNNDLSSQINQFRSERESIVQNLDTLKDKNEMILEQIQDLKNEKKEVIESIQQLENKNSNIANDVENISTSISELIEKHNHIEENIDYLKEQRKLVIGDINTLKNKNEYILDNIAGLKNEKNNILEIVRYLKEDQKYIVNDIDNLKTERIQLFKEIEILRKDNQRLLEKNETSEKMKKLQITNKKMASRVKKMAQVLETLEKEIVNLQELNSRLTNTEDNVSQARLLQSMQISNINKQLEELRKAQELNQEEKIKNSIKEKKERQEKDNIISINTLRKKNKKIKKVFSIKNDIMYYDLENASEIIIDLKDTSQKDTKIANH